MTIVERTFSRTIFPVVMVAAVAMGLWWTERGGNPAEIAGAVVFASGLIVFGFERVFPYHRSWVHSKGDLRPDIAYAFGIGTVVLVIVDPLVTYFGVAAYSWMSERVGADLWPVHWPLAAQIVVALVVAELPKYWNHRLQHTIDFLWRFHATHHSAPRLYWLNAARFHPLDTIVDGLVGGIPLLALGCGPEVIALFAIVSGVHGFFQHGNILLDLGPLNYFFSMAELHRWHHSKTLVEANHNYGQNVIVWDLVFGTFFWPKDREPPEEIGIPDLSAFPTTFWRQLASPLTWNRIKQESRAGDSPSLSI